MTLKFETLQLHGGHNIDSTKSRAVPIYQTTSYIFDNTEYAKNLFELKQEGNIYSRIGNPTTEVLEKRLALLEGGVGALVVSSGSTAIFYSIMNIVNSGDEIIASNNLYGGTFNLLKNTLNDYNIKTNFFNAKDPESLEKYINSKTKLIYIESVGNPSGEIIDIEKISFLSKKYNLPLIVDNTFAPKLIKPFLHGADIIVYSATKFLGGHGNSIGGVIIDSGNFNWKNRKFKNFNLPDKSYQGLIYSDLPAPFVTRARVKLLRDTGGCISPFNSFLILQGIETLSLRLERHVYNAEKVAKYLFENSEVKFVTHPKFSKDQKELLKKYMNEGATSIFTFGLKGGKLRARKFIDSLKLFSHLANVADAKSLIIHPASTTHSQLTDKELLKCTITPDTIRISVGLEHIEDLIFDLEQAILESKNYKEGDLDD